MDRKFFQKFSCHSKMNVKYKRRGKKQTDNVKV